VSPKPPKSHYQWVTDGDIIFSVMSPFLGSSPSSLYRMRGYTSDTDFFNGVIGVTRGKSQQSLDFTGLQGD